MTGGGGGGGGGWEGQSCKLQYVCPFVTFLKTS